jgi:hypothetical protein
MGYFDPDPTDAPPSSFDNIKAAAAHYKTAKVTQLWQSCVWRMDRALRGRFYSDPKGASSADKRLQQQGNFFLEVDVPIEDGHFNDYITDLVLGSLYVSYTCHLYKPALAPFYWGLIGRWVMPTYTGVATNFSVSGNPSSPDQIYYQCFPITAGGSTPLPQPIADPRTNGYGLLNCNDNQQMAIICPRGAHTMTVNVILGNATFGSNPVNFGMWHGPYNTLNTAAGQLLPMGTVTSDSPTAHLGAQWIPLATYANSYYIGSGTPARIQFSCRFTMPEDNHLVGWWIYHPDVNDVRILDLEVVIQATIVDPDEPALSTDLGADEVLAERVEELERKLAALVPIPTPPPTSSGFELVDLSDSKEEKLDPPPSGPPTVPARALPAPTSSPPASAAPPTPGRKDEQPPTPAGGWGAGGPPVVKRPSYK